MPSIASIEPASCCSSYSLLLSTNEPSAPSSLKQCSRYYRGSYSQGRAYRPPI